MYCWELYTRAIHQLYSAHYFFLIAQLFEIIFLEFLNNTLTDHISSTNCRDFLYYLSVLWRNKLLFFK